MTNIQAIEYLQNLVLLRKGVKHKKRILSILLTLKDQEIFYEKESIEAY